MIRCTLFSVFVGRKPATWPANNCLQIMVCSRKIIFCSMQNKMTLSSFLWSLLRENGRSLRFPNTSIKKQTWWLNDKTIILLLNLVIEKYHDLSMSRRSIIYPSLHLWQISAHLTHLQCILFWQCKIHIKFSWEYDQS